MPSPLMSAGVMVVAFRAAIVCRLHQCRVGGDVDAVRTMTIRACRRPMLRVLLFLRLPRQQRLRVYVALAPRRGNLAMARAARL